MSHCYGDTLEYFVEDSYMNITEQNIADIVKLLEPHRKIIEEIMLDFDHEEQSWRDTRNGMAFYFEEYDEEIDKILGA